MDTRRQTLWMAAAALAACGLLSSCRMERWDDDEPERSAVVPASGEGSVDYDAIPNRRSLTVDAWAQDISFAVPGTGRWEAVGDRRFVTCTPGSGKGGETVTLRVQNNQSGERKEGHLAFLFADDATQNTALFVEQKSVGDYPPDDDRVASLFMSNKVYAVGFSYDATGEYASPNSVKAEVFDTGELIKSGILSMGPTQLHVVVDKVTGSSISEVATKLAVSTGVQAKFGPYKAEMEASFNMSNARSSNYEYATAYVSMDVRKVSFTRHFEAMKDWITEDAWNALNGLPTVRRGKEIPKEYPATNDGFYRLLRDFGTHVVVSAGLGGRARYSMEVDASNVSGAYDVGVMLGASCNVGFLKADVNASVGYGETYKNNSQHMSIRVDVLGGDQGAAVKLCESDEEKGNAGFTKDNLNAWMESVADTNMALVSFDANSLVPIQELVDRSVMVRDTKGKTESRYDKLCAYLEGRDFDEEDLEEEEVLEQRVEHNRVADLSSYDCGTVVAFDKKDLSFDDCEAEGTLVKDIWCDGQLMAQVCNEYIPNIDFYNRVTVIYPVLSNKVKYNMGFFIGNESHKPARVSWFDKNNVAVVEYPELDYGSEYERLFLRGTTVMADTVGLGMKPHKGEVKVLDEFVLGLGGRSGQYAPIPTMEYPIVKVFGKIWTRTEYLGGKQLVVNPVICRSGDRRAVLFKYKEVKRDATNPKNDAEKEGFPQGWLVASMEDFLEMSNKLVNNRHTLPLLALEPPYNGIPGGVTGFKYLDLNAETEVRYLTRDGYVVFDQDKRVVTGTTYTESEKNDDNEGYVRLVQEEQDQEQD